MTTDTEEVAQRILDVAAMYHRAIATGHIEHPVAFLRELMEANEILHQAYELKQWPDRSQFDGVSSRSSSDRIDT